MALPLLNTAKGGTVGVAATTSNTGGDSGNYFTSVVGDVVFSDAHPAIGALGYRCSQVVAGQAKLLWGSAQVGAGVTGTLFTRHYVWIDSAPGANILIFQARGTDDLGATGNAYSLRLTPSGNVELLNQSGQVQSTTPNPLPWQTLIRIETRAIPSGTVGRCMVKFFYDNGADGDPHGATAVMSVGDETTDRALRGSVNELNFGIATSTTGNTHYVDELAARTDDWIGPAVIEAPPAPPEPADFYRISGGVWVPGGPTRRLVAGAWT